MGIYLLSVAFHDALYRDQYNRYALTWMDSWSCTATGAIAMLSCEVSVFILATVSIDCCLAVTRPYHRPLLTMRRASGVLAVIWSIGLGLAALPVSMDTRFYGGNGVCMPLHIHERYLPGWQYSAVVFLGVNSVAVLTITASYATIAVSVRRSRRQSCDEIGHECSNHIRVKTTSAAATATTAAAEAAPASASATATTTTAARRDYAGMDQDSSMAKRFFVIVLTDVMCWIPIAIIKIMALADYRISGKPSVAMDTIAACVLCMQIKHCRTLTETVFKFTTSWLLNG